MSEEVIASIINAGAQLVGQGMAGRQRRRQYAKQRQFNKQMAQWEWEKNLEMWHKQNEYNSPVQQMMRFEEAGLNPNLIYGQGTPGNASQMPTFQAPNMPVDRAPIYDMNKAIDGALKVLNDYQSTRKAKAEAEKATWNVVTERAISTLKEQEVMFNAYELGEIADDPGSYKRSIKAKWTKRVSEAMIAKYQGQLAKMKADSIVPVIKGLAGLAEHYGLTKLAETLNQMVIE